MEKGFFTSPKMILAEFALALGVFSVAFAIRGYDLSALIAAPDELTYATRGIGILAANWAWPRPYMFDQPPLFTYLLAAMIAAQGATLDTLRLLSVFAGSLTAVIAYFLGKSMYGRIAGLIASIAILFDGFDILYSRQIYIEALATMLIMGAALLFWEGVVKKRSYKLSIVGGLVFGLALDSKYIALVMAVALVLFLFLYWNKFQGGAPWRQTLVYLATALGAFIPVQADLAANGVNPFYYDLVQRFQLSSVKATVKAIGSGQYFFVGFKNFIQVFFHVSSTNPYGFPLESENIILWTVVVIFVLCFFIVSFFWRKNLADGFLLILFVGLLAFAFAYPDRKPYFALYPSLILLIMMGRMGQLAFQRIRLYRFKRSIVPYLSAIVIALTLSVLVINALAVPVIYQNGYGSYDEISPILSYVNSNHNNNSYLAIAELEVGYYAALDQINVSIVYIVNNVKLYSEPTINQSLQTPLKGTYPFIKVITTSEIGTIQPQFLVITTNDFQSTPTAFQQYVTQRYYQPLDTKLILLFQVRPGNQSTGSYAGCC
ncbi:MAG: glycosyltransferase family 39 protein [Nitrososphaerales archaeon]